MICDKCGKDTVSSRQVANGIVHIECSEGCYKFHRSLAAANSPGSNKPAVATKDSPCDCAS